MVVGPEQEVYFVILMLFYVPLENISLIWWRHNDQSWMAANYKPILGTVRTTFDQEWVSVATSTRCHSRPRCLRCHPKGRPSVLTFDDKQGVLMTHSSLPLPLHQLPSAWVCLLFIYCSQSHGSETHQCFALILLSKKKPKLMLIWHKNYWQFIT